MGEFNWMSTKTHTLCEHCRCEMDLVEPTDALARRPVHVATICARCLTTSTLLLTDAHYAFYESLRPPRAGKRGVSASPAASAYRILSEAEVGNVPGLKSPRLPGETMDDFELQPPESDELTGERVRADYSGPRAGSYRAAEK